MIKQKSILLGFIVLTAATSNLSAQQQLTSNQNVWLLAAANPAAIGNQSGTNLQALYRKNWTQAESSPSQLFCRIENSTDKQGADVKLQQYKNQFYERTEIKAGYKYKLQIDEQQFISIGLRFGFLQSRYNFTSLHAQHPDENILLQNSQQNFSPISDFGVLYTSRNFNASFVAQNYGFKSQIYAQNILRELPHFTIQISQRFQLSRITLTPILQTGSSLGLPLISDISLLAERKQKLGLQCGFKSSKVAYLSMRYFTTNHLAIAIGFDYPFATSRYMGYGNEMAMYYFSK